MCTCRSAAAGIRNPSHRPARSRSAVATRRPARVRHEASPRDDRASVEPTVGPEPASGVARGWRDASRADAGLAEAPSAPCGGRAPRRGAAPRTRSGGPSRPGASRPRGSAIRRSSSSVGISGRVALASRRCCAAPSRASSPPRIDEQDVGHLAPDRLRVDAVLGVVRELDLPAALGLADRRLHRVGDVVGVHQDRAVDVARRAADRLDRARSRSAGTPPCRRRGSRRARPRAGRGPRAAG